MSTTYEYTASRISTDGFRVCAKYLGPVLTKKRFEVDLVGKLCFGSSRETTYYPTVSRFAPNSSFFLFHVFLSSLPRPYLQMSIAGEIMENARTVFTHLAEWSVDRSVELTADVHLLVFHIIALLVIRFLTNRMRCLHPIRNVSSLTPLEPQSHFGDTPLKFQVICPQIGTAVLKGLTPLVPQSRFEHKPL